MRRLKLNREQFVVIFMAAFIVTVGTGYFLYIQSLEEEIEFKWSIDSDTHGIYWVAIQDTEPIHLDKIYFRIDDSNGNVAQVTDPDGHVLQLEGRLSEVLLDWDDFDTASECDWPNAIYEPEIGALEIFYTGVPSGNTNLTLFIVYYSLNDKMSSGDFMLIRSVTSGSSVKDDYHLRLTIPDKDEQIAKIKFPHAIKPIDFKIKENQNDYRMRIIDCEPWPLTDIEYLILDHYRLVETYDDLDGEQYRMEGNLSDIIFDPDEMDGDVYRDIFYTNSNHELANITWYIVYMDSDSNGLISSGDTIWIRDVKNGGAVDEDHRFRLRNKASGMAIVETTMIRPTNDLIWNMSNINGTFCVNIINITRNHLDNINFNLTTPDGRNATAIGPDGQSTTIYGRLREINFSAERFEQENASGSPNATFQDKFYASEYDDYYEWGNRWWINRTLFIALEDLDSNGRLSNGDKIWVRSQDQGGAASSGYALTLTDGRTDREYPVITFY